MSERFRGLPWIHLFEMEFYVPALMHDCNLATLKNHVKSWFSIGDISPPDRCNNPLNPCSKSSAKQAAARR
jgi:hypothetical protein